MAVTITNKFYETITPAWHDIAKIVFTSPNMNNPVNAGTRSHILPGKADLGLWYEDTSKMYRIMEIQDQAPSSNTQVSYMDIIDLYPGEVYSFATETSVLVTIASMENLLIDMGDRVYYDGDNYGVVSSIITVTSGTDGYEDRTITIYDGNGVIDFFDYRRKGYSYKVYWTTTGVYTDEYVDLYYSINGGVDWLIVASGIENSGVAEFTISTNTTAAQLKVVSTLTQDIASTSSVFRVDSGAFNILTPSTGALWRNRNTHRVWWNCDRFFKDELVNIAISFNGGTTWTTLLTNIANIGYADIDVPSSISSRCIVKVYSVNDPASAFDISSEFSTYAGTAQIIVPDNNTIWRNRNQAKVWWNSGAFYNEEAVNVKISYDSGSWLTLASGIGNTGYALLDLPSTVSNSTKIRVESTIDYAYAYDETDLFSVSAGGLSIVGPSPGTVWYNRRDHKIWWNSASFYNTELIDLDVSYDGGYTWDTIVSGTINTGYYTYTFPANKSGNYTVIKVKSTLDPILNYDIETITVVSGSIIDILYPTPSSTIGNGVVHTVWWNSMLFYSNINMLKSDGASIVYNPIFSYNSDTRYYYLSARLVFTAYSWSGLFFEVNFLEDKLIRSLSMVIQSAQTINVTVAIYGVSGDSVFFLAEKAGSFGGLSIDIATPDYFSKYLIYLYVTSTSTINLTINNIVAIGDDSNESSRDRVDILLTNANLSSTVTLASGIPNLGYADVFLPYNVGFNSNSVLIVRDYNNPDYLKDSLPLTVTSGSLSILYPTTSGNSVIKGEPIYVWWNSDHIYNDNLVSVGLSTDSGSSYDYIFTQTVNSGTAQWLLPSTVMAGVNNKVAVFKNDGTEGIAGESLNIFTIEEPYLSVISPTPGTVFRLYNGDEYWFSIGGTNPIFDIIGVNENPVDYHLWWNTNIRDNKNVIISLSTDGGNNWAVVTSCTNEGNYSILNTIVQSGTESTNCLFKVDHTNTEGTFFSSTSQPFTIEKPWEVVTNYTIEQEGWASTFYYKNFFYHMRNNDKMIYRFSADGSSYESFVNFTESVIKKPVITLKNDNIYIINAENKAFYEYLYAQEDWRTLTPLPDTCSSLESFSDTDPYLYCVSNVGSVYRFNLDVYGGWTKIYENVKEGAYAKSGITCISGTGRDYILIENDGNIIDIMNNGITVSGSLTVSGSNFCYDLKTVAIDSYSGLLFSVSNQASHNYIYKYTIVSGTDDLTLTASGVPSCLTEFSRFHADALNKDFFSESLLSLDLEYNENNVFSFINNSNYISEWTTTSGTTLFEQDYTYYSIKESTDNACFGSFITGDFIYVASGPLAKIPFFKISLVSGTVGFPEGATYFNGYHPLDNSYVGLTNDIMCTDGDYIYKFDGAGEQGFYKYDVISGTITYLTSPPVLISDYPQVVYNAISNCVYLIHDDDDVNNLWKYDIVSDIWSTTEDSPYVISKSMLNSSGNYIFVLEGGSERTNLMRYNVLADVWEQLLNRIDYPFIAGTPNSYHYGLTGSCANSNYIYGIGSYTTAIEQGEPTHVVATQSEYINGVLTFDVGSLISQDPNSSTYVDIMTYTLTFYGGVRVPVSDPGGGGTIPITWTIKGWTNASPSVLFTIRSGSGVLDGRNTYTGLNEICELYYNSDEMGVTSTGATITINIDTPAYTSDLTYNSGLSNGYIKLAFSDLNSVFTSAYKNIVVTIILGSGSTIAGKYIHPMMVSWTSTNNLDNGFLAITTLDAPINIGSYGLKLIPSAMGDRDFITRDSVTTVTASFNVPWANPPQTELSVLQYDIDNNTWSLLLKRVGISDSFDNCYKASCVCDDSFMYILWNGIDDADELVVYKVKLNQIDYASVATPISWVAPPADTMMYIAPVGWDYPTTKSGVVNGWTAPPTMDYVLETSPVNWITPSGIVLASQPVSWEPPTNATLEPQPIAWVAPPEADDREPTPPTYGPNFEVIQTGPPVVQVPYAKSITFSSKVGTSTVSYPESLYVWCDQAQETSWLNVYNSILFEITNGECYNCRLTAWDDVTHSTTLNTLLSSDRCRVHALAFNTRAPLMYTGAILAPVITKSILTPPAYVNGNRYLIGGIGTGAWVGKDYQIAQSTTNSWTYTTMAVGDRAFVNNESVFYYKTTTNIQKENFGLYEFVKEPAHDLILKGNVSYYGDFIMKYRYQTDIFGDYLMFKPYLYNIDETISYGVYDFYITLHYSYT